MDEDIAAYKISGKRLTGQVLKVFFTKVDADTPAMVLELDTVAAFIDYSSIGDIPLLLSISEAGSYGIDIAMRLKNPAIKDFEEVFLFTDLTKKSCCFRGIAQKITWRKFDHQLNGDINY